MTSPQPTYSGDAREDHAQLAGAGVGNAVAQAELVVIATVAILAKRVAIGSLLLPVARARLARTADTVLMAGVHRALLSSGHAAADLTPYLNAATQAAIQAAQEALTAAAGASGAPQAEPLARLKAAQQTLDDLGRRGLTGFVDQTGRHWNLATYSEMATRAAISSAWDATQAASLIRAGIELVVVGTHSTEGSCAKCRPWLGRTLSLTSATPDYPSLADAKAVGFRHPNCRCSWGPSGMLAPVPSPADLARSAAAYEAAQHQRTQGRRVRVAHRRMAVAITPRSRIAARRELGALHMNFRRQRPFQSH
jgi:hypothetical protein